jgi:hypothetical protein
MWNGKTELWIVRLPFSLILATLFLCPGDIQAAEAGSAKTINDIKPPFEFSISTQTPDGKPQPGVKIRCLHPRARRGKAIIDMVATSDEEGVAKFNLIQADLVLDRYFWFSLADEHFVGSPGVGISPVDNEYEWTFKVLPAAEFKFSVRDEDGKPIARAKLQLYADHPAFPRLDRDAFRAMATATTNEAGLARVKYAQVETNIVAAADGWASTFVRGASLSKDEPYEITLRPGCSITGKVVDSEGNPVGGVVLSLKKKDFIVGYMNEFILKATTDEKGTFILKGATEGAYEIQAQMRKPHEALYANPISVDVEGDAPVVGVKILAEQGAVLKGKYVTKHKLKTGDRTIFVNTSSPTRNNWRTQTAEDGSFVISGLPPNARGSVDFIGVSGYHESLKMSNTHPFFQISGRRINFNDVPPGVYDGVEVHFLLAGRITGKVLDHSGNPIPNQELVVRPPGYIHKTNDKGEYTAEIPPLKDVTLEVRDPVSRQVIISCDPFRIKEGEVIEKNLKVGERSSKLVGESLPDFEGIDIEFSAEQAKGQMILACLWDMEQRPSRNCVVKLAARAAQLKQQGVAVIGIQVAAVEKSKLDAWAKKNNIPFPVGFVEDDGEKTRSVWGARSLPWLILTNNKHVVASEGFPLGELDKRLAD